jgi:hypothetical protein
MRKLIKEIKIIKMKEPPGQKMVNVLTVASRMPRPISIHLAHTLGHRFESGSDLDISTATSVVRKMTGISNIASGCEENL